MTSLRSKVEARGSCQQGHRDREALFPGSKWVLGASARGPCFLPAFSTPVYSVNKTGFDSMAWLWLGSLALSSQEGRLYFALVLQMPQHVQGAVAQATGQPVAVCGEGPASSSGLLG